MTTTETLAQMRARRQALPTYGDAIKAMPTAQMQAAATEASLPRLGAVLDDGARTLAALDAVLALCDQVESAHPIYDGYHILRTPEIRAAVTDALGDAS